VKATSSSLLSYRMTNGTETFSSLPNTC